MRKIALYFKLIAQLIKSQMEHKASFLILTIAHFFSTSAEIFGIWVLFERFKIIEGWTLPQLTIIYGVIHMSFATAETVGRGFDRFSFLVRSGDFDRVLLRPMGTLFQIAASDIHIIRIGRFFQGLLVLCWGFRQMEFAFFSFETLVMILAFIGTAALFYGLFVFQAAISFWTTETLELMNITTFGGLESGQYPMKIYHPLFKLFFTFVVPLACVIYYPIAITLGQENFPWWIAIVAPFCGIAFLLAACQFWKLGVRNYRSTGS